MFTSVSAVNAPRMKVTVRRRGPAGSASGLLQPARPAATGRPSTAETYAVKLSNIVLDSSEPLIDAGLATTTGTGLVTTSGIGSGTTTATGLGSGSGAGTGVGSGAGAGSGARSGVGAGAEGGSELSVPVTAEGVAGFAAGVAGVVQPAARRRMPTSAPRAGAAGRKQTMTG